MRRRNAEVHNRWLTLTVALGAVLSVSACAEGDSVPDTCAGVEETKDNREYPRVVLERVIGYAPIGRHVSLGLLTISNGGSRRLCADRLEMRTGREAWMDVPNVHLPLVVEPGSDVEIFFDVEEDEIASVSFEIRARVNDPRETWPTTHTGYEVFAPPEAEGDPCWQEDANCPDELVCDDVTSRWWGRCVAFRF